MVIEVEQKAFVSKAKFDALPNKIMSLGATDLGPNDTDTVFYITDKEQLKVQRSLSKNTAKIAWKSGGLRGRDSRQEIEVPIAPADTGAPQDFIQAIVSDYKKYTSNQTRRDFQLGNITISLKYSDNWGYHVEIDTNVSDGSKISESNVAIEEIAQRLDIKLMTESEETAHLKKVTSDLDKAGA